MNHKSLEDFKAPEWGYWYLCIGFVWVLPFIGCLFLILTTLTG